MHIPDGFLTTPVNSVTAAISLACVALAIRQTNKTLEEKQVPLLGVAGAFLFAAQMLNFPVAGGTSGHLLGALLASLLLGALPGTLVIGVVLGIQCLLFADGGITALGSNFFNMAIIGGLGGVAIFSLLHALFPKNRSGLLSAVAGGAWASVLLAAAACAVELALSGTAPLHAVLPAMLGVHLVIGIGEALITVAVVAAVLNTRPDLLPSHLLPKAADAEKPPAALAA